MNFYIFPIINLTIRGDFFAVYTQKEQKRKCHFLAFHASRRYGTYFFRHSGASLFAFCAVDFAFSFYLFHTAKSNKNYELTLSTTNPFSIKKEFLSFFMADGKHVLTLLILCMIVEEFFYLLDYAFEIETLVNTILYFVFPFSVIVIPTPILGTLISALCFFVLISVFTVFSRYRLYKKWKKSQAEHL